MCRFVHFYAIMKREIQSSPSSFTTTLTRIKQLQKLNDLMTVRLTDLKICQIQESLEHFITDAHTHYHNNTLTNIFTNPTHPMQLLSSLCSVLGLISVTLARFKVWYIWNSTS